GHSIEQHFALALSQTTVPPIGPAIIYPLFLIVHPLRLQPHLNNGDRKDQCEEDKRERRCISHTQICESREKNIVYESQGTIAGTALSHDVSLLEDLEGRKDSHADRNEHSLGRAWEA